MSTELPAPYILERHGRTTIAALPDALPSVRAAIARAGTLHRFAATHPDALRLEGRGPAHAIPAENGARWIVRHYRRGGALRRLLGDRYSPFHEPRPFRELRVVTEARRRGIRTPEVVAALHYSAVVHVRGDIAHRFLPDSLDLAAAVFGDLLERPVQLAAAAAAGALLRDAHERGLIHPDLNLKNFLLDLGDGAPRAWLLDLDRARFVRTVGERQRDAMLRRVDRSFAKFEAQTRRSARDARAAFHDAYASTAAAAS